MIKEGNTAHLEAARVRNVRIASAAHGKQCDHFGVIRQGESPDHGRGVEAFHRCGIPAERLEGEHEVSEGNHHLTVDPNRRRQMGQKGEGIVFLFLLRSGILSSAGPGETDNFIDVLLPTLALAKGDDYRRGLRDFLLMVGGFPKAFFLTRLREHKKSPRLEIEAGGCLGGQCKGLTDGF